MFIPISRTMNKKNLLPLVGGCLGVLVLYSAAFKNSNPRIAHSNPLDSSYQKLTDEQKRSPKYALAGIDVAEGLRAELFAHEPMLTNPTNIDIDERGRVWVCEAYNYRPAITGNPTHPVGDRIVILEDTDGDSKADKSTVFYQDPELNAPLGIWVMGNKVIVSQSPYVWLLTDENGDGKADKKEVIFQGIGGEQHDHGMHAFVFGPDGKFYFNFGNSGSKLLDAKGQPVVDKYGVPIDFKKNKQGIVFRCDPDFTNLEVLGNNFRNNYEVAVDSYGTLWQSDNDDDGNKGVRINYVMEFGNYGYTDELTGAGWRANRTNIEDSIPFRHWHLNDPGVVPNLLQTGAGSPTGMTVYEGRLLPKVYWDQVIHCDAGPNIVRSYPVRKEGAGYSARIVPVMEGKRDQWFRPSDVCVAPDGSLFVADWYDPGVGGHQAGDQNRGRIYRVAPEGSSYRTAPINIKTVEGALAALQNPNLSARYMGWNALVKMGNSAKPALSRLGFDQQANPRMRARALWALSKTDGFDLKEIKPLFSDTNPDLRCTALRIARQTSSAELIQYIRLLANDKDPQVRRECAIALYHNTAPEAAEIWALLAQQHDGNDRWYLEALGIGADNQWDRFFSAWLKVAGSSPNATAGGKDIIWRSRSKESVPLLASLASDPTVELKNRLRYFRAFDFAPSGNEKSAALLAIMKGKAKNQNEVNQLVLRHIDPDFVKKTPEAMAIVKNLLKMTYGTPAYIEIISKYEFPSENKRLLELAISDSYGTIGRAAGAQLLKQGGAPLITATVQSKNIRRATAALASIKAVGSDESLKMLTALTLDEKQPLPIRREAVRSLGGTMKGEDAIVALLQEDKLTHEVKAAAIQGLAGAWRKSVKAEAAKYLASGNTATQKHPEMKELLTRSGNSAAGKLVFSNYCSTCHQVNGEGADFGPKLSEIGSKLPKEAQYLALYYPSAGISFGYEGFEVKFKDGSVMTGVISSKTETDLIMKFPGGTTQEYKMTQVKSIRQLDDSMMPSGLQDAMTTTQLTDLIEYLGSLKKK